MERKRARLGLLVVIALQDTKKTSATFHFRVGYRRKQKGSWLLGPCDGGKNPCLVVLGMCKNSFVILGYVWGRVRDDRRATRIRRELRV